MRTMAVLLALTLSGVAFAQSKGFKEPPKAEPAYEVSTNAADHTTADVAKTAKTGRDIFIGSYITIDKTCKVGKQPQIEFIDQPANGAIRKRRDGFNLTQAPGVPRNKCLGVSPEGIAVMYVSKPRFKGDDTFKYKVLFPDGRTRTVKVAVTVQ